VNSRQPALVLLSVLSVAAGLAETSTGTRGRSSSVDAAGCHDKTRWSGARQSLERDLASGFLTPSASIDDGRLASQVATYMRARLIKDVDTLLDFMVASDAPTRQRQRISASRRPVPRASEMIVWSRRRACVVCRTARCSSIVNVVGERCGTACSWLHRFPRWGKKSRRMGSAIGRLPVAAVSSWVIKGEVAVNHRAPRVFLSVGFGELNCVLERLGSLWVHPMHIAETSDGRGPRSQVEKGVDAPLASCVASGAQGAR